MKNRRSNFRGFQVFSGGTASHAPNLTDPARSRSGLGRFDSLTRGHPNGGNAAQTRRSGRPGRTAESGGIETFAETPADGEVAPIAALRELRSDHRISDPKRPLVVKRGAIGSSTLALSKGVAGWLGSIAGGGTQLRRKH